MIRVASELVGADIADVSKDLGRNGRITRHSGYRTKLI